MIEGLDNRTRIPCLSPPSNTKTRHITDYKLDNVILILQAFILYYIKHAGINTTLTMKLFARFRFDPHHHH
jgi:hypothetical protein